MSPTIHVAKKDLPTRCACCGCRIDHGDRYTVHVAPETFIYEHADCTKTAFKGHLEREKP